MVVSVKSNPKMAPANTPVNAAAKPAAVAGTKASPTAPKASGAAPKAGAAKAAPKAASAPKATTAVTALKPRGDSKPKVDYSGKKIVVLDKTTVDNRREGTWSLFMNTLAITCKTTDEAQKKVDASKEWAGKTMDWNYLVNARKCIKLV